MLIVGRADAQVCVPRGSECGDVRRGCYFCLCESARCALCSEYDLTLVAVHLRLGLTELERDPHRYGKIVDTKNVIIMAISFTSRGVYLYIYMLDLSTPPKSATIVWI